MKNFMLSILLCSGMLQAQVPKSDSSRAIRKPGSYTTDSVRSGNETYQGGKGKSKSQGDTLSRSRHQGTHSPKSGTKGKNLK